MGAVLTLSSVIHLMPLTPEDDPARVVPDKGITAYRASAIYCTDRLRLVTEVSAVTLPPVASMPRTTIAPSESTIPIASPLNAAIRYRSSVIAIAIPHLPHGRA